jgi:hypothetical protein
VGLIEKGEDHPAQVVSSLIYILNLLGDYNLRINAQDQ